MKKVLAGFIGCILALLLVGTPLFFGATPFGRAIWNSWFHEVQKADDRTSYETRRTVENTCRSMIASYNSDKLMYEQYKDSDDPEKQSWGEQAKIRANKTASNYNNYILKNNYVWKENVPNDIFGSLPYID